VLIQKCKSTGKHLETEKEGAGTHSVPVVERGPLTPLRKWIEGIKIQAAPERPHTTYPEVLQHSEKTNGTGRKLWLLPFHLLRAAADLSHCFLIIP